MPLKEGGESSIRRTSNSRSSIRGSWKIGEFAGISVYVHATFLILLAWVLWVYWSSSHSMHGTVSGVLFTLALFTCVVLHEFGHALTARRYGIRTVDITLLPIGGVSRLQRIPDQPKQEFYVALMGPIVSISIAFLLFLVLRLAGGSVSPESLSSWTAASFLARLVFANAGLAVFNLLPAFPMDGGRIFRALLARFLGLQKATRIAAGVGHGIAILFGLWGLLTNPFLILIAFFIWMGATQEAAMVEIKSVLDGISARDIMLTDFAVLSSEDPLQRAVELALHGRQRDFPVIENGRLVGMLTNKELLKGLAQSGPETPVSEVIIYDCPVLSSGDDIGAILEKTQTSGYRVLPVVDHGELVGLFMAEGLAEFAMVQSALNTRRSVTAASKRANT
jgi:Zn-dependent protease